MSFTVSASVVKVTARTNTEKKILTQTYSIEIPYNYFKDVIQSFYCILILKAATITQKGHCWPIHFVNDSLGRKCKHSIGHYVITRNMEREGTHLK